MALNERELNKRLKLHLKTIYDNSETTDKVEKQRNVAIVEKTAKSLLTAMKSVDSLFKELYQKPSVNSGLSYPDVIGVKSATEFEINVVLRLPIEKSDVKIVNQIEPASVQFYLLRSVDDLLQSNRRLRNFFHENGKLLRCEVEHWMQSVIDNAFRQFHAPLEVISVTRSQNSQPLTYYLRLNNGHKLDLNLVIVIDCTSYNLPSKIYIPSRLSKIIPQGLQWFLISKSCKNNDDTDGLSDIHWRIVFPEAEKRLLDIHGCVKMLIKLIKILRDCQEWETIYSYYIKTLFLLEIDVYPNLEDWQEDDLGTLLMKMLRRLKSAIDVGKLPHYFDRGSNLIEGLDYNDRVNISRHIQKIITGLTVYPDDVILFFTIPESNNAQLQRCISFDPDRVVVYPIRQEFQYPCKSKSNYCVLF